MKNELGDIPKIDLDDNISEDDKLPEIKDEIKLPEEIIIEEEPKAKKAKQKNQNYYSNREQLNKILTIVLVSAITIVILILLGFGLKKIMDLSRARKADEENKKLSDQIGIEKGPGEADLDGSSGDPIRTEDPSLSGDGLVKQKVYYKGFEVAGYLRIPKTNLNYPIVKPMSNKSLEVAVAQEHTVNGINKPGNTTISGHNYRNEDFFANNYKIQIGDAIYVKDMDGVELKYDVYDIQELGENDKSFVQRNTNGGIEVTLSTCTDNVINRIVIFAKYNPST